VYLQLSFGLKAPTDDEDSSNPTQSQQQQDALKKVANVSILCRICKGNHFSSKCPFKDTHKPLDEIQSSIEQAKAETASTAASVVGGKYVPPSQRAKGGIPSVAMAEGMPRREEQPTIRISNLSEDVTEPDVRVLVRKFGNPTRVVSSFFFFEGEIGLRVRQSQSDYEQIMENSMLQGTESRMHAEAMAL
jgi:translation initiation factor 3 subunit G